MRFYREITKPENLWSHVLKHIQKELKKSKLRLDRNLMMMLEEKKNKDGKFKTNFMLVLMNNCARIIPIYKAKTSVCKNMSNNLCIISTNIVNITKKKLKSKQYVVLILSRTVCSDMYVFFQY
jgi:hypothetical protein